MLLFILLFFMESAGFAKSAAGTSGSEGLSGSFNLMSAWIVAGVANAVLGGLSYANQRSGWKKAIRSNDVLDILWQWAVARNNSSTSDSGFQEAVRQSQGYVGSETVQKGTKAA